MIERLKAAIKHWEIQTCLRFETYNVSRHSGYKSIVHVASNEINECNLLLYLPYTHTYYDWINFR